MLDEPFATLKKKIDDGWPEPECNTRSTPGLSSLGMKFPNL